MHNQKIRYLLMVMAGGIIGLLSLAQISHATVINEGGIFEDTVWTKSGSPYVIESSVFVPKGITLKIESGVEIIGSPSIDGSSIIDVEGSFIVDGKDNDRVSINGYGSLNLSFLSISNIKNCDISVFSGINVYKGKLDLSESTVKDMDIGIQVTSGTVNISGSELSGNKKGLVVQESDGGGIFPVLNNNFYGVGGTTDLFVDGNEETLNISISNSNIINNSVSSIENLSSSIIEARNNWWGSKDGPTMFGENKIKGPVDYYPWTLNELSKTICCSNILFIPGLQATRLYSNQDSILGSKTNRLWEPNRNRDVERLFLDKEGVSINNIYPKDIISNAYGLKDVYGIFTDYLKDLKDQKIINEWRSFGYDWRLAIDRTVYNNQFDSLNAESLIDTLYQVASSSKTGKVTVIAHSNGGLVLKYLVKILNDFGKSDLIDKTISVAVPYLGTPQAILGLMHGYDQSIAAGLILSEGIARKLGENMASAYSLLPSRSYFSTVLGPTVVFASTTIAGINNGSYPKAISSYGDQYDFLADTKNSRNQPKIEETNIPIKGNRKLMNIANLIHDTIDFFTWPISISNWSIAGFGKKTIDKIVYSEETKCGSKCKTVPTFDFTQTINGDGTVVSSSAIYDSDNVVSLDLAAISKEEDRNIKHSNILGASTTIKVVDNIIKNTNDKDIKDKIIKISGANVNGLYRHEKEPISLVISTHSPVDLHVYDESGRHVGIASIDGYSDEEIDEELITIVDEDIPGSSFSRIPDGFGGMKNYAYLSDNNGENYTVVINGNGFGDFTYRIERLSGDISLDKIEYKDIPVTPFSVATTTIIARDSEGADIPVLLSSPPKIDIDMDGDGLTDFVSTSTYNTIGLVEYYRSIKNIVEDVLGSSKKGRDILKKIDKIIKSIEQNKFSKARDLSEKLNKYLGHKKIKNINVADKEKIIQLIELYLSQF